MISERERERDKPRSVSLPAPDIDSQREAADGQKQADV